MTARYQPDCPPDRVIDAACIAFLASYPSLDGFNRNKIGVAAVTWLSAWRSALGYHPSPFGLGLDFSAPDWHAIDAACAKYYSDYPGPYGPGTDFPDPDWGKMYRASNANYSCGYLDRYSTNGGFRELGKSRAKPIKANAVKWLTAWRKAFSGETYVVRFDYGPAGGAPSQKWARSV